MHGLRTRFLFGKCDIITYNYSANANVAGDGAIAPEMRASIRGTAQSAHSVVAKEASLHAFSNIANLANY